MAARDLFLSYHSPDRAAVQTVRQLLEARGLATFLDREHLVAGLPWPQALEEALRDVRGVAVFLGPGGPGLWQKREIGFALDRQVEEERTGRTFPVIPVLLPNADPTPGFLFLNTWVDLRHDVADPEALDALVRSVRGEAADRTDDGRVALCPYQGLRPFREEDAAFFCGRNAFADRLSQAVPARRLVAVVGPSGSGKSSVVQAGLLPRLRRQRPPAATWDAAIFTPGDRPFHSLAAALVPLLEPAASEVDRLAEAQKLGDRLAGGEVRLEAAVKRLIVKSEGTDRLLLVADQFEELFTQATEPDRGPFVEALLGTLDRSPLTLVITLRSDFYGHAIALSRELSDRLEQGVVNLGPMTPEELEQAIVEPARRVGLEFEPGLVETILDDLASQPGALPLLEHALLELWQRRRGRLLTLEAYRASGGVEGAIAKRAEAIYQGLGVPQQAIARRVLLRLTQPGEGTEDTRRRAALGELVTRLGGRDAVGGVIQELVDARLLTTSGGAEPTGEQWVDVSHEALIRGWPRLRQWIEEDRTGLVTQRRLTQATADWRSRGRDPSFLYGGTRLAEVRRYTKHREEELSDDEREFLAASAAREAVRERARYLGQAAGGAVGAALGYSVAFTIGFWFTRRDPLTTPLAFLTMFPVGGLVGFCIGLGLWLGRRSQARQLLAGGLLGLATSSVTYALFLVYFLGQPIDARHVMAGAFFGAGVGLGAALSSTKRRRLLGTTLGGVLATGLALAAGGITWSLPVTILSGLALGGLTGLGFQATAVEGDEGLIA